jgi:hypothetical protein
MLTQEQIERMNDSQYLRASQIEAEADAQKQLQALSLTPRHMLPFFSISDYEKARRGEPVTLEQPRPIPVGFVQTTDDRSMSQYLQDVEPAEPLARPLTISKFLEARGDPAPLYMFVWQ